MKLFKSNHNDSKSLQDNQQSHYALELDRKTKYLGIFYQFALSILDINNIDELMWYVAKEVVARMNFEDCVIYQINKERNILVQKAACGIKNPSAQNITNQLEIPIGNGIVGAVASTGKAILVSDVRKDPRYIFDVESALSELSVPIIYKCEVLGVIDCEDLRLNHFTDEHLEILTTIASILSTKISQIMTIERLEETIDDLEYAEKLQTALFNIATLAYSSETLTEFYTSLHEILDTLIYTKNLQIGLYDREKNNFDIPCFGSKSNPKNSYEKSFDCDFLSTLPGYVITTNISMLLNKQDIKNLIQKNTISKLKQIPFSWLGVTFEIKDQLQGIIVVQSYNENISFSNRDKEILQYVSNHISAAINRRLSEKKLQHQALHDSLTGLPNRLLLIDRIGHALDRMNRKIPIQHALLFLDLDRFKIINDSLGHLVGDQFLKKICGIIGNCLRNEDTLARLGGDEFAILLEDIIDKKIVFDIAKRINLALNKPILINDNKILCSTSIGIAFTNKPEMDPFELLQQADAAMYRAKALGSGLYCEYDKSMHQELQHLAQLEHDIAVGIINNEFILYYQPIFNIIENELVGFEALVRWAHPKKGLLNPSDFIDHAELTGHIIDLDKAMLCMAAQQIQSWFHHSNKFLSIHVNISSKHFSNPVFASYLTEIHKKFSLPKGSLCIEITERVLIENLDEAKKTIEDLRSLGIKIILDDFGTGYSSLSYLHKFPIDVLKIDKSFINNIEQQTDCYPIITAIVALAKSLNLKVIAEGIEKQAQQNVLSNIGCDYGQGYLLAKPLDVRQALSFMKNSSSNS